MLLDNMRVLSFSHFIQGPSASQYLADMGADVIKVEPPDGAWERKIGSGRIRVEGKSVSFMAVNRNKRSLVVDLKHPRAKDVLYPIIKQTDAIMENYRQGVLDRYGFGYEDVKKIKPDIIYASASGWGPKGPLANKPGVDILIQARSGLISVTGNMAEGATAPGVPIVDHHGGTLLAMGVMAAYIRKLKTGKGTRVETSLLNAGLDLQGESLTLYRSGGKSAADIQRDRHLGTWFIDAPYGVYKLADCHVAIAISGPMDGFAEALQCKPLMDLGEQGRLADRSRFAELLAAELASWTFAKLDAALGPKGFWYERVATYDDVFDDNQIAQNGCFAEMNLGSSEVTVVNHPVRYDGKVPPIRRPPPALGQDTRDILSEAGFASEQISALLAEKAVHAAEGG